jgi:DNA topoisomerase-3
MCELVEPEHYDPAWKRWSFDSLPMVPAAFALQVREGAREHWALLSKLIQQRGLDEVVNACDAGREGELIFRYVWEAAGGKARVSRLWLASLTEGAIKGAWAARKPAAAYDALGDAARCRSEADWLVGLNATRAMTCLARSAGGDQLLSVGRVQTPTLAMIVGRDREIADFVPEDFWRVEATLLIERVIEGVIEGGIDGQAEGGRLRARWFRHDLQEQPPEGGQARLAEGAEGEEDALPIERLPSAILAHTLVEALREQRAVVLSSERKEKREAPPLLYDLTSLQRRANQRYGLSADRTLELAQSLYEARLITYPRTDARYITPDQVAELPPVVQGLAHLPPYTAAARAILARPIQPGRRVVNADEVGDHHAILPTAARPDPGGLQPDQKRIYDLIARRLLAALSPDAIFDLTALVVEVPAARAPAPLPSPPRLRARGRVCRERGWQAIDPPAASKDRELPLLTVGGRAQVVDPAVLAGATRPPRPHTEASLLYQMETAGKALDDDELKRALRAGGLGTPATRAAIIETLLKRGFIERRGKELHALGRGVALIAALPVEELKSPALTGRWEARLHHVAEGKESRARFMADVRERLGAMVGEMPHLRPACLRAARALRLRGHLRLRRLGHDGEARRLRPHGQAALEGAPDPGGQGLEEQGRQGLRGRPQARRREQGGLLLRRRRPPPAGSPRPRGPALSGLRRRQGDRRAQRLGLLPLEGGLRLADALRGGRPAGRSRGRGQGDLQPGARQGGGHPHEGAPQGLMRGPAPLSARRSARGSSRRPARAARGARPPPRRRCAAVRRRRCPT